MKRIYNYNTGKLYESEGSYRITVEERSLNPKVKVNPEDENVEYDETYVSREEALDTIDKDIEKLPDIEGCFDFEDVEVYDTKDGKLAIVPGYKEWKFTISGDIDECGPECKKQINEVLETEDEKDIELSDLFNALQAIVNRDCIVNDWKRYHIEHNIEDGEMPEEFIEMVGSPRYRIIDILRNNDLLRAEDFMLPENERKVKEVILLIKPYLIDILGCDECKCMNNAARNVLEIINNMNNDTAESNESVTTRFSRLRSLFEESGIDEKEDEKNDEKEDEKNDEEDGDKKDDDQNDNNDEQNTDDDKDSDKDSDEDEEAEMKAVIITVKKGDEDKCKEELIDAGVSDDDIEILEGDEDDENVDIRIDVKSVMELKDYLEGKGIDLEEEIGGEIIDDSDEDSDKEDDKTEDDNNDDKDDEEDLNFDDLGDIFGADEEE